MQNRTPGPPQARGLSFGLKSTSLSRSKLGARFDYAFDIRPRSSARNIKLKNNLREALGLGLKG